MSNCLEGWSYTVVYNQQTSTNIQFPVLNLCCHHNICWDNQKGSALFISPIPKEICCSPLCFFPQKKITGGAPEDKESWWNWNSYCSPHMKIIDLLPLTFWDYTADTLNHPTDGCISGLQSLMAYSTLRHGYSHVYAVDAWYWEITNISFIIHNIFKAHRTIQGTADFVVCSDHQVTAEV